MTGGCQCGAIRYEIGGFPLLLYTCNCTDCQRQSGSAFALNMPVAVKHFRIVRGEPKGMAPSFAERRASDIPVLRRVRDTALR
jgi:hypothetical protein